MTYSTKIITTWKLRRKKESLTLRYVTVREIGDGVGENMTTSRVG